AEEAAAHQAAAAVRAAPFDLTIDAAGSFQSVWWLGQRQAALELLDLRKALQGAITARRVSYDRQHFTPHVTIARNAKTRLPASTIAPIQWRCDSFELMQSALGPQGSAYKTVASWSLGAAPVVGQMALL
ncbi:MAG: RNA 2',3'-cyclic phosphodiesterase, partial [Sphingomicrobium sp.]